MIQRRPQPEELRLRNLHEFLQDLNYGHLSTTTGMEHDLHNRNIDNQANTATAEFLWSSKGKTMGIGLCTTTGNRRPAMNGNCSFLHYQTKSTRRLTHSMYHRGPSIAL